MFHDYQINLENSTNLNSSLQGGDTQNIWDGGGTHIWGLSILWGDLITP